jgi:hypothetical protein
MTSFKMPVLWIAIALTMVSTIGCDDSANSGASDMDSLAAQLEQNNKAAADAAAAEQARVAAEAKVAADKAAAEQAAQAALQANQPAAAPENETTITITVKNPQGLLNGVAPQGRGQTTAGAATVGEGGGYYSAIAAAHRHITTRVDDLAWQQAIQHYKATNGSMPKDNDEFMKGVIEGFGIELPPLEEGEEYLWVPDEGELGTLYVVRNEP